MNPIHVYAIARRIYRTVDRLIDRLASHDAAQPRMEAARITYQGHTVAVIVQVIK